MLLYDKIKVDEFNLFSKGDTVRLYKKAEKELMVKYEIDLLEQIVLARNDRAVYYVEYLDSGLVFTKIHGKSPLDICENGDIFNFSLIEKNYDMTSKYGEVVGQQHYKNTNINFIRNMTDEANITIPVILNHQRFWIRMHLYTVLNNDQGKPILASCYITDVTKYLIYEEQLYEKTHKDELSGLFNRYTLHYHFELHGNKTPIVGMYFDIDDFKVYNDTYGHDVGDMVITRLSENLKSIQNDDFISYRIGGDEFFALIFNSNLSKIEDYVNEVSESIKSIRIPRIKEKLSISIGVVYTTGDITHKSELFIKEADRLMYVSKRNGKDRHTKGEFIVF